MAEVTIHGATLQLIPLLGYFASLALVWRIATKRAYGRDPGRKRQARTPQ